jgi:peptidylprolyl isomerase domain and WD repeat-containing protein 1
MDPTVFAISYKRNRFYLFTKREPAELETEKKLLKRDVQNEKTAKDEVQMYTQPTSVNLAKQAIIETSMGEIHIKLFAKDCPKTVENFVTHARNGYYNNVLFHRVIKSFMIQTGDPDGNGTGGESIWGGEFEDEFSALLRHDLPFTVSMANHGPNTNGSQFFITTVPCPWLDNKHTVFGRVFRGMDTVQSIENVKVDFDDKPLMDIRVLTIKIIT